MRTWNLATRVTGSMSAGSSKLKGRLRDLLRTVKEEAVAMQRFVHRGS